MPRKISELKIAGISKKLKHTKSKNKPSSIFKTYEFIFLLCTVIIIGGLWFIQIPGSTEISLIISAVILFLSSKYWVKEEFGQDDLYFLIGLVITTFIFLIVSGLVVIGVFSWWKVLYTGLIFDGVLLLMALTVKRIPLIGLLKKTIMVPVEYNKYKTEVPIHLGVTKVLSTILMAIVSILLIKPIIGAPFTGILSVLAILISLIAPIPGINTFVFILLKVLMSLFL